MEDTFDMAYRSYNDWTSDQCARMLDALKKRLADEEEQALAAAGRFDADPLYQPISGQQLRRELLDAQAAYLSGESQDALAFCAEMEGRRA